MYSKVIFSKYYINLNESVPGKIGLSDEHWKFSTFWDVFLIFSWETNTKLEFLYIVKVSKSRKQFWKLSILPKNERKTWKNYPKSSQDNFFSCFVRFLEELRIPIFFRDLLTFNNKCQTIEKWGLFRVCTYGLI